LRSGVLDASRLREQRGGFAATASGRGPGARDPLAQKIYAKKADGSAFVAGLRPAARGTSGPSLASPSVNRARFARADAC